MVLTAAMCPIRANNVLELVLTSENSMIDCVKVIDNFATSDHKILLWKTQCKTKLHNSNIMKYAYHKAYYLSMDEWLIIKLHLCDLL